MKIGKLCYFLLSSFLMLCIPWVVTADTNTAAGTSEREEIAAPRQVGLGGVSGSRASGSPAADAKTSESARETQALKDGKDITGMRVPLGSPGQIGLGGASGSSASRYSAADARMPVTAGEAHSRKAISATENKTGISKPGLGGSSGSQTNQ